MLRPNPVPAYDANTIFHLGISGGKDSTALWLWMWLESGIPHDQIIVSASDTGNEHDWTYWYLRLLSRRIGPLAWLRPPLDFYELARKKRRFPSQVARFCTEHLKIKPLLAHVAGLEAQGKNVILCSGVRTNESTDRLKQNPFDPACRAMFGKPTWKPLFYWSIEDVWAIHSRYNVPRNPLYVATQSERGTMRDQGGYECIPTVLGPRPFRKPAKRVGCFPCINSRKSEVANIARNFPERIDMIREAELTLGNDYGFSGFFHHKAVPKRFHSQRVELKPLPAKQVQLGKDTLFPGTVTDLPAVASKSVTVPTIDDVVRWALSDNVDRELTPAEKEEVAEAEEMFQLGLKLCAAQSGACE